MSLTKVSSGKGKLLVSCILIQKFIFIACLPSCNFTPEQSGFTESEKKAILEAHNGFRQKLLNGEIVGLPKAKEMLDLEWDKSLEDEALRWANLCPTVGSGQSHPPKDWKKFPYGQNVAWGHQNVLESIKDWIDEYKPYIEKGVDPLIFRNPGDSERVKHQLGDIGHFTAIVTSKSNKIGCSVVKDNRLDYKVIYVCNYSPPGNIIFLGKDGVAKPLPAYETDKSEKKEAARDKHRQGPKFRFDSPKDFRPFLLANQPAVAPQNPADSGDIPPDPNVISEDQTLSLSAQESNLLQPFPSSQEEEDLTLPLQPPQPIPPLPLPQPPPLQNILPAVQVLPDPLGLSPGLPGVGTTLQPWMPLEVTPVHSDPSSYWHNYHQPIKELHSVEALKSDAMFYQPPKSLKDSTLKQMDKNKMDRDFLEANKDVFEMFGGEIPKFYVFESDIPAHSKTPSQSLGLLLHPSSDQQVNNVPSSPERTSSPYRAMNLGSSPGGGRTIDDRRQPIENVFYFFPDHNID